jgi:hypothetical protein
MDLLPTLFDLEMDILGALCSMEQIGSLIDEPAINALDTLLAKKLAVIENEIFTAAGDKFNLNSGPDKAKFIYEIRGHKPLVFTNTGKPSTAMETIEKYAKKDPLVQLIVDYADIKTKHSTFVVGLKEKMVDGYLYPDFVQYGTVTGRFSCVSGETPLHTSRGTFRFDEYLPVKGDLVPTHMGNWQPVKRKIYKGVEEMYRVRLSHGYVLQCTLEHKVLTSFGWKKIMDLAVGDKVLSYVGIPGVCERPAEYPDSFREVLSGGQANSGTSSPGIGNPLPEHTSYSEDSSSREKESREITTVLSLQEWNSESNVRQEWLPTSQLQGGNLRWTRISYGKGWAEVSSGTSPSDGRSAGNGDTSEGIRRSPHRWDQNEQFFGQPGVSNFFGASSDARIEVEISEIAHLGPMGVWDIEVEGDHSYLSAGFYNHNCRAPNLQNIPRAGESDIGDALRALFISEPGHQLVVADYSQVEYRILACMADEKPLINAFLAGHDAHTATAAAIFGVKPEEVTKEQRGLGKNVNFAMVYGASAKKVAAMSKITVAKAEEVLSKTKKSLPAVEALNKKTIVEARRESPPHVRTMLGRKRRLPELMHSDQYKRWRAERQAFNTLIQGSAADVAKLAMVDLYKNLDSDMHILLTVHDEFVVSTPDDKAEKARRIVTDTMQNVGERLGLAVPLKVDAKLCTRWSDGK